jgi:hypothetical protein
VGGLLDDQPVFSSCRADRPPPAWAADLLQPCEAGTEMPRLLPAGGGRRRVVRAAHRVLVLAGQRELAKLSSASPAAGSSLRAAPAGSSRASPEPCSCPRERDWRWTAGAAGCGAAPGFWLWSPACSLRVARRRRLRQQRGSRRQAARQHQRNKNDRFIFRLILTTVHCSLTMSSCYDAIHTLPRKASHIRMALIIRSSAIHAAGCYTTTAIRKGARVAEYTGHRSPRPRPTRPTKPRPSPTCLDWATAHGHRRPLHGHVHQPQLRANCETSERTAASGSRPSARSPPARRSPTTTASTTAATTRPCATAAHPTAAARCTRRKRSSAARPPQKRPQKRRSAPQAQRQSA